MTRAEVKKLMVFYREYDKEIALVKELEKNQSRQRRELEWLEQAHEEIADTLNRLPYLKRRIIADKYLNGWKWERIQVTRHISERCARYKAKEALDWMAEQLEGSRAVREFLVKRGECYI